MTLCYDNALNLNDVERPSFDYISGYVTFKENIPSDAKIHHANQAHSNNSEFTNIISKEKLKYPFSKLYDICLYSYSIK